MIIRAKSSNCCRNTRFPAISKGLFTVLNRRATCERLLHFSGTSWELERPLRASSSPFT